MNYNASCKCKACFLTDICRLHHSGEINREDYDKWRYNYPKYDEASGYVKVPSQQLSDAMVEAFKDRLKND